MIFSNYYVYHFYYFWVPGREGREKSWPDFCHRSQALLFLWLMVVMLYRSEPRKHQGSALLFCLGRNPCCNLERKLQAAKAGPALEGLGSLCWGISADSRFAALESKPARDVERTQWAGSYWPIHPTKPAFDPRQQRPQVLSPVLVLRIRI